MTDATSNDNGGTIFEIAPPLHFASVIRLPSSLLIRSVEFSSEPIHESATLIV